MVRLTSFIGVFCAIAVLGSMSVFSEQAEAVNLQEAPITFSLPVNATSTPKYHLTIRTPENYQPIQDVQSFSDPNRPILEFIPKNEIPVTRSRIFTVHKFIGAKISASNLIQFFKDGFKKADPNVKVLEENIQKHDHYEEAYLAMEYHDGGRHEVVYMRFFSGPFDTAGAQAAIVVKQREGVDAAVDQCKKLVDSAIQIISF